MPSSPSHKPVTAMTAHRIVVTVGHGESSASIGAKKKPVPMNQDDPARSDFSTKRSQRGMDESTGLVSGIPSVSSRHPSRCPARVREAITSEVVPGVPPPSANWYDHLTSGHWSDI